MAEEQTVSADDGFRLLACRQRRVVIRQLRDADGTLARERLVERVGRTVSGDVAATLHHRDLPMLEDYELIEFDGEGSITYRPNEFVETLLAWAESR